MPRGGGGTGPGRHCVPDGLNGPEVVRGAGKLHGSEVVRGTGPGRYRASDGRHSSEAVLGVGPDRHRAPDGRHGPRWRSARTSSTARGGARHGRSQRAPGKGHGPEVVRGEGDTPGRAGSAVCGWRPRLRGGARHGLWLPERTGRVPWPGGSVRHGPWPPPRAGKRHGPEAVLGMAPGSQRAPGNRHGPRWCAARAGCAAPRWCVARALTATVHRAR